MRDHNWGTPPGWIAHERIEAGEDSFRITFEVRHHEGSVDFSWAGLITGDASGTIVFHFDGVARSAFRRNRIGICVLHPARDCPGAALRVAHADGSTLTTTFPSTIAPWNPHTDILALAHEVAPGCWCRLEFAGECFEMEDQRNWVDASFKTFCTPLHRPFPVEIPAGTRVVQSVRLSLEGPLPCTTATHAGARAVARSTEIALDLAGAPCGPLPALGLAVSPDDSEWSETVWARLRALNLSHVRAAIKFGTPSWPTALGSAVSRARLLDLPVELALFLDGDSSHDLAALAACLDLLPSRVARWLVVQNGNPGAVTTRLMNRVRRILGPVTPRALFGGGTDTFLVFLNRDRPAAEALDFLCYSLTPQVHASDHRSLVETLEAHLATVETARTIAGGKPVVVSPVTFRMRYNPAATAAEPPPAPGELPPHVDPRQMSLFGAAWTLGSIKYLAEAGAAAATYFETTGWRGVMETETGSPLPQSFPSVPGSVFPLYHVLADAGEFARGQVVPLRSRDPLRADGLALADGKHRRVLLANLAGEPQTLALRLPSMSAGAIRLRRLNEHNAATAARSPEAYRSTPPESLAPVGRELRLALLPCEIARLDFETQSTPSLP